MDNSLIMIATGSTLVGIIIGWFLRHGFLNRQYKHCKAKLDEIQTMHTILEQETVPLRQKLIYLEEEKKKLESNLQQALLDKQNIENERLQSMKEQLEQAMQDKEELILQLNDAVTEKSELIDQNAKLTRTIQNLESRILSLKHKISTLKSKEAKPFSGGIQSKKNVVRSMESQSTDKFGQKKKTVKKEQKTSTGIRMLEQFAKELQDPGTSKNSGISRKK